MLFNSYIFIFAFLPITLAGFYLLGAVAKQVQAAIAWLVLASLFFYGWWNPAYLALIGGSILFNYMLGMYLGRTLGQPARARKFWLVVGISANLATIGYFKYANFFVDSVNVVIGSDWHLEHIVLPLAISFFTFQQIAYLVDAYRGETREYNFLHYCLFVTFFPQLIAGPIVHHREMLPQFARAETYRPLFSNFTVGLTIFALGLFKKVIIADNFALVATPVFDAAQAGADITFFDAWRGAFAYTFQLYFDFSGYSDMAIGLARLFGIRLPLNFHSPYQSYNIIEFWRRWHITLSRFLRDYLYIPLGGNRRGPSRRYVNLLLTMLLGGLWHGAGWTFVMWGALHGIYLIINHAWLRIWKWGRDNFLYRFAARVVTLIAVLVGWVYFRAESFAAANHILAAMVNLPDATTNLVGPLKPVFESMGMGFSGGYLKPSHFTDAAVLAITLAVVWYCPNTQQWMARMRPALDEHVADLPDSTPKFWTRYAWRPGFAAGVVTAGIGLAAVLGLSRISEFLYFQF
ncbi:MAG: MBOAT family protein [Pseudomonadota bacterium]